MVWGEGGVFCGEGERRFFSESLNHKTAEVGRAPWGPPGPPLKQGDPEQGAQGHVQAASEDLQGRPYNLSEAFEERFAIFGISLVPIDIRSQIPTPAAVYISAHAMQFGFGEGRSGLVGALGFFPCCFDFFVLFCFMAIFYWLKYLNLCFPVLL